VTRIAEGKPAAPSVFWPIRQGQLLAKISVGEPDRIFEETPRGDRLTSSAQIEANLSSIQAARRTSAITLLRPAHLAS